LSFARYAAIVKNLRGVVVGYLEEPGCVDSIKWLAARFRYRDLGVGPLMVNAYRDSISRYLGGKPLREIVFPLSELREFAVRLSEQLGLDAMISEALVLASTYVSPLLAIGTRVREALEKLSVAKIVTDVKSLDVQGWKLHLRIADYTILDFYEQCVTECMQLLSRGLEGVEEILRNRVERIERDTKRYWRISKSSGEPFLLYIDMLRASIDVLRKASFSENVAAALAIVPVVCIPPGMK